MSQFDAENLMSEPSKDPFYDLKKDELISLAKYLQLEVRKAMRKYQIQDVMLKHLLEEYQLQLQLELKKLEIQERLEREERE